LIFSVCSYLKLFLYIFSDCSTFKMIVQYLKLFLYIFSDYSIFKMTIPIKTFII